jgi:hypothetical protein
MIRSGAIGYEQRRHSTSRSSYQKIDLLISNNLDNNEKDNTHPFDPPSFSLCSAQSPVKSCPHESFGTLYTVEVTTDPLDGTPSKVGVVTGQCYKRGSGTKADDFVGLL